MKQLSYTAAVLSVAVTLLIPSSVVGLSLLNDLLDNRNIDYGRFERTWGYLHHAIVRLNLDENNWEGGDSTTIYEQNDLSKWTHEEKRLLTFFLFLNFQFTRAEVSAIGTMIQPDAERIGSQLAALDDRDLAQAVARGMASPYVEATKQNFRRNVQYLRSPAHEK